MTHESETIGNCTLYRGDCFEVMPMLSSIDAIISDPPYGTTNLKWDTKIDLDALWNLIKTVRKDNAVTVMFSQQPFTTDLINANRQEFRYEIIWSKTTPTGFLDAKVRPLRSHETIVVFTKSGHFKTSTYNPQMTNSTRYYKSVVRQSHRASHYNKHGEGTRISPGTARYPLSVINQKLDSSRFNSTKTHSDSHPTQKPVGLKLWLVNTYSNAGDIVLDPFMGSGTTGVACVNTGRRFIGIEQNQKYFDIACRRIEKAIKDFDGMFPEVRAVMVQKELF